MATEQFCLRWNDFHANITSAFSEIKEDEDFLDVTLVCDGDMVRAHKLVLSACSPLFRVMLKKNSHPQPMIFLRGIRFPDMVAILNFMYHGEVNVNQEDLQMFLAAAEELRIKGLSQASNDATTVPKKKLVLGAAGSQPPAKKAREGSPGGGSPASSGPGSARSPGLGEEEGEEGPQLSVKREFASGRDNPSRQEAEDEEGSNQGQGNLLDCLMQAGQGYSGLGGQGGGHGQQTNFEQNNYSSAAQHLLGGGGSLPQTPDSKGLLQFLGQNSANVSSAAANAIMMQRLLGTGYELHPLGSRKDNDPLSHIKVARSSKGWHCPQCIHISSTKGNLKSHILSGRHKTYTEKPFGCQYCDRSYGTKQSLQVHISTNHRAERDAEYQALSKSLGMKNFPEQGVGTNFYQGLKTENYDLSNLSTMGALSMSPATMAQLQQMQASKVPSTSHLNLVRNIREAAAVTTNGGHRPVSTAPGLAVAASLSSCRLEARTDGAPVAPKTMEIQTTVARGYAAEEEMEEVEPPAITLTAKADSSAYPAPSLVIAEEEDEEEEEEEVAMAVTNVEATMDTSITTP